MSFPDEQFEYDEPRTISLGMAHEVVVVGVVHVEKDDEMRIISMRKATRAKRNLYAEAIKDRCEKGACDCRP